MAAFVGLGAVAALGAALLAAPAMAASVNCSGVADATALLNRAASAGGRVQIGPGTCVLSGSLLLPSGTTLSGAGIGRTVLRASRGGAFNVIQVGGGTPATGSYDVDVSGLTIDASATAGGRIPHESSGVLVAFGSSGVRIHGIEVEHAADNGIDVSGSHVDVTDNLVHDNWHNGIYVIGHGRRDSPDAVHASYIRILRNRVDHNSLDRPPGTAQKTFDGIDLDPLHAHCLVDGNTVIDDDIIMSDHGAIGSGPDVISNNTVTYRTVTIVDAAGGGGINVADNIDGFRVTGNHITDTRHFGIIVGGRARNGVISGNVIRGTTAEGIILRGGRADQPGGQNIEISDNQVWPGPVARGRPAIAVRRTPGVRVFGNDLSPPPGEPGPPGRLDLGQAGPGLLLQ